MKYTAIQIQGNLIAEEILQKVEAGEMPGQAATDFGLEPGSNLRSEIEYAWSRIKLDWKQFNEKSANLSSSDPYGTGLSRKWMKNFLGSLGFELRDQKTSLPGSNGQNYTISHTAENAVDLPIHIVGFYEPDHPEKNTLDIKTSGGTTRYSPHGTMQEYLNVTDHVFGITANGLFLRLMRDSGRLIKLTYLEFDLKRMLDEDKYSEFTILFRLLHYSRFPRTEEDQCFLDKYYQESIQTGNRIRDGLSKAVKLSLLALGQGFLKHPDNDQLRIRLRNGELNAVGYYRQLLRVIYRLLFLMVTEERDLIYDPEDKAATTIRNKKIYLEFYSVAHLRRQSEKGFLYEAEFDDLWLGLVNTFRLFEADGNGTLLGVAPLDGALFGHAAIGDLQVSRINNRLLLECIRNLNEFEDGQKNLVPVNYRSLDVEELGSVYEGLLELHPVIEDIEEIPARIGFNFHEGTDRKTTASYYTRPELVNELIKSALIPVIEARLKSNAGNKEEQIRALLRLKVCDAAAGSGHMLLAAARTIAWYLARLQSGDENPPRSIFQKCLREVIQHCIYGVDMNPAAVELCKLALWLEGHNSGKPLSFLDHKIRNGNSLVGVRDLNDLNNGIPGNAYQVCTGDDKNTSKELKKRNTAFSKMAQYSLFNSPQLLADDSLEFSREFNQLENIAQDDINSVNLVQEKFEKFRGRRGWWKDWTACNIWTAAFFKTYDGNPDDVLLTSEKLQYFLREPDAADTELLRESLTLSKEHKFFHWPLEFPDVFEQGGFDVMLGNPPWERVKLQQEEFFATRDKSIANAPNAAARTALIRELPLNNPALALEFQKAQHISECTGKFLRESGRYPLTAVGDVNTYPIFTELACSLLALDGKIGIIVPTGIATDDSYKAFFQKIVESNLLVSLFDFENRFAFFPDVHRMYKFCLLTIAGSDIGQKSMRFGFFLSKIEHLQDPLRIFNLSKSDFVQLNPNTKTCPVFRTSIDANLSRRIYSRFGTFIDQSKKNNPWGAYYIRLVDFGDHQNEIQLVHLMDPEIYTVPVYEAKMFWNLDHRLATFAEQPEKAIVDGAPALLSERLKQDSEQNAEVRYFAKPELAVSLLSKYPDYNKSYFILWRDVTNATNERTSVASIIPNVLASRSSPAIGFNHELSPILLLANLNSLIYDYFVRQKVSGLHFNWGLLKQTPVLPPSAYSTEDTELIVARTIELVYTAWDVKSFADDVWHQASDDLKAIILQQWNQNKIRTGGIGWNGREEPKDDEISIPLPPFKWEENRRAELKAELDSLYARIYGLSDEEIQYILDPADIHGVDFPGETFRVLKDKEIRLYGEYRTGRLVLDAWRKLNNNVSLNISLEPEMIDLSLHQGIYSIGETAAITGFSTQKVTSWFNELNKENYEGIDGAQARSAESRRISFHGLIELVVIGTLRENGFTLKKILKARANLTEKTQKSYPFATNNVSNSLKAAGSAIIWEFNDGVKITLDGTSQINIDFITLFFRDIVFKNDIAQRLMPAKGKLKVIIDPHIGLGKPVIIDKEVPVDMIAAAYVKNPGSIDLLKNQYDLNDEEVMAAVAYMQ